MSLPSIEEYRREVARLLDDCVDQKLLQGGTKNAIAYAQEAYEIATGNNVPSPWPEFAAYRLAHLKLRSSPIEVNTLREIDSLFAQASHSEKTGPIPLIYRLAVLHRLVLALNDKKEISQLEMQFEEVYSEALRLMRRMKHGPDSPKADRIERQSAAFNMLEFAAYIFGKSYEYLEGCSSLSFMDPFSEGKWFVVGKNIDRINMTEEMARWEFEQRAADCSEMILIEFNNPGSAKLCFSKKGQKGDWKEWNSEYAKLVLLLLQDPGISRVDLERKVVGTGGENPNTRFRKAKSRVKQDIALLTGYPSYDVFDGDPLRSDVPILGLVHAPSRC